MNTTTTIDEFDGSCCTDFGERGLGIGRPGIESNDDAKPTEYRADTMGRRGVVKPTRQEPGGSSPTGTAPKERGHDEHRAA
mmetsp:Transcript_27622/g.64844  ORF Transcript_27622/g.64844 Transcript_27622/m.64844 type:complete len:81 (+) Transcript_27622:2337-2579(+)